jgi:hypothetical protein
LRNGDEPAAQARREFANTGKPLALAQFAAFDPGGEFIGELNVERALVARIEREARQRRALVLHCVSTR